jgi:hypothetical protein
VTAPNPFLMVALPWQCGCLEPVEITTFGIAEPEIIETRKTQPGTKMLCGFCGARRPTP